MQWNYYASNWQELQAIYSTRKLMKAIDCKQMTRQWNIASNKQDMQGINQKCKQFTWHESNLPGMKVIYQAWKQLTRHAINWLYMQAID